MSVPLPLGSAPIRRRPGRSHRRRDGLRLTRANRLAILIGLASGLALIGSHGPEAIAQPPASTYPGYPVPGAAQPPAPPQFAPIAGSVPQAPFDPAQGTIPIDGRAMLAPGVYPGGPLHPHDLGQPVVVETYRGPISRLFHKVGSYFHTHWIGRPELFQEPPFRSQTRAFFDRSIGAANTHRFTLYQSDFLVNTTALTSQGASKLQRIQYHLLRWPGDVIIEAVPGQPTLALRRRERILETIEAAGIPFDPARVVVPGVPLSPERDAYADEEREIEALQAPEIEPERPEPINPPVPGLIPEPIEPPILEPRSEPIIRTPVIEPNGPRGGQ